MYSAIISKTFSVFELSIFSRDKLLSQEYSLPPSHAGFFFSFLFSGVTRCHPPKGQAQGSYFLLVMEDRFLPVLKKMTHLRSGPPLFLL
jgi:hypothetical protein